MDFLTILVAISSVLTAFAFKLAASELHDWMPLIAARIIDRAVARLPSAYKQRYREEWHSHLDDCPGAIGKLVHACGCFRGLNGLAKELSSSVPKEQSVQMSTDMLLKRDFKFHCASCGAITRFRRVRTIAISPVGDTISDISKMKCSHCNEESFLF